MKYIKKIKRVKCDFNINEEYTEGHTIEEDIERAMSQESPIESTTDIIYTNRKDGVLPQFDIRTDRWELAQHAMNSIAESIKKKREMKYNPVKKAGTESDNSIVERQKITDIDTQE